MQGFRARTLWPVVFASAVALDTSPQDCQTCDGLSNKACLAALSDALASLSDASRLAFLQAIFAGSFQTASHLEQLDSAVACETLPDDECLAALDADYAGLSDKYKLTYLVAACNQNWSLSFNAESEQPRLFSFAILTAGLGVLGLAAYATVALVRRRRRTSGYSRLNDLELEDGDLL